MVSKLILGVNSATDNRHDCRLANNASKVKKGDYFEYKVRRTKDGIPYWTMSPEERAKERTY